MSQSDWISGFIESITTLTDVRLDYIPIWISDFLADENVHLMSTEQKGAYLLLLMRAWQQWPPASMPDDEARLSVWAGLRGKRWRDSREIIMAPWMKGDDGRWYQKRLASEWLKAARNYLGRKRGAEIANRSANAQRALSDTLSERSANAQRAHPPKLPNPNYPTQITEPNPTQPKATEPNAADAADGGNGVNRVAGGLGGLGGLARNLANANEALQIQALLSQAGVGATSQQQLLGRRDITLERVEREWADVKNAKGIADRGGLLVSRLNGRARR